MIFYDTIVLATAWLNRPKLGNHPARTLLVGASTLIVRHRFGGWSFDLQVDSTTITDNPADTMLWVADQLPAANRLILWRAEDIVVPSLIAAAETAHDTIAAAKLLRQIDRAFCGEVVDIALSHGGARATSFDEVAHAHNLPFIAMSRDALAEAHRIGNHGDIQGHLAARVKAMWRLWLSDQPEAEAIAAATVAWITEQPEGTRA